ncbi:hypothetical protein CHARACLAT_028481 [Characodon lateralis]|uniref:Uncharacterized protein n=1 Tax=Characodon lateralis TaxID=208331 RepID=A0ABU7F018_9TELE|nr:hypothetical protein [Characodon lateralis]
MRADEGVSAVRLQTFLQVSFPDPLSMFASLLLLLLLLVSMWGWFKENHRSCCGSFSTTDPPLLTTSNTPLFPSDPGEAVGRWRSDTEGNAVCCETSGTF